MNKSKIFILPFIILILCITSCHGRKTILTTPKEINVVKSIRETIVKTALFTGSIEAEDFAEVYPRGLGKVTKKILNEGDPVKKNQAIMYSMRDEVGYTFKPMPVVSPISGFIGRIMVDVGATIGPQTPVATVVKSDKMRIKLDVPERYLPNLKNGIKVEFSTDTLPNEKFEAEVTSISQAIDLKTRTSKLELCVDNKEHKLTHGMFAKLDMPIETRENTIVVPMSTISWEADKQFVYKVIDGVIIKKPVTVGIRTNAHVEILDGVSENELLAAGNLLDLKEGEKVSPKEK